MSRFEEAVAHDLAGAVEPPPLDQVRRRAARQRARWAATSLLPILVAVAALAIVVTTNTHHGVNVSTATSLSTTSPTSSSTTSAPATTLPPAVAALPVATTHDFPYLDRIMQQARGYDGSDGRVDYGEVVATTRDKLDALFGGRVQVDTRPVAFVRLVGEFTCNSCSVPPGGTAPHGNQIFYTVKLPATPSDNDVFSVGSQSIDLATFGTVYRLPLEVSARIALPTTTMRAGSTMTAEVIVENDTGVPVQVGGCGQLFNVALGNATIQPEEAEYMCLRYFTIPTGSSSYPVTITTYRPNAQPPVFPTGAYHLFLFGAGSAVKTAPPPTVQVTP